MTQGIAGIVLAAGKGTRMRSESPKCLFPVCGVPMADLVGRALRAAGVSRPVIVVGHEGQRLIDRLGDGFDYAWQHDQLGTGHATRMGMDALPDLVGSVFICPGDVPLISPDLLRNALAVQQAGAHVVLVTAIVPDAKGYGRVVRNGEDVAKVVEDKDASPEEKSIREVNSGVFCVDAQFLREALPKLNTLNEQGEYLLPDIIGLALASGLRVAAVTVDPAEVQGVNTRWQLAQASETMKLAILRRHAEAGVTILDLSSTVIGPDVEIGLDSVIEPATQVLGKTTIGSGCRIGPSTLIDDSHIGDNCIVFMSRVSEATMESRTKIGPFSNLRPGAVLCQGAKIGNFVEIKNSSIGPGTSISHLTYIGDAEVGSNTNIGAGTITCNYDGYRKSRTKIGDGVFVGSNSTLVAPVELGDGVMTAAGSVVTSGSYPADALVIGRSRTEVKGAWAAKWRKRNESNNQSNDAV